MFSPLSSTTKKGRSSPHCTLRLKCDGTRAETRFCLSAKQTSPFKSAGASVQSTTGSRGVRISGSSAGYTMFRGSVKSTGYPLHSPVSPSLPLPCVIVCHQISTGLYLSMLMWGVVDTRCYVMDDMSDYSYSYNCIFLCFRSFYCLMSTV